MISPEEKLTKLEVILKSCGKMLIAFSGGVDSTFLLQAAVDAIGAENVTACISKGPSLPASQYIRANKLAQRIGTELITIETQEFSDDAYLANEADRCFLCKSHLFDQMKSLAKKKNFDTIACGHNLDDTKDYRPGNKAADELGIASPLIDAELTKLDIRLLSKKMKLPTAELPASPCLASRVPYGQQITKDKLKQVELAEEFLADMNLVEFRIRHHGDLARIELHPEDMELMMAPQKRKMIVDKLKSLGFKFVAMDLTGFRSGSLNEVLSQEQKDKYIK